MSLPQQVRRPLTGFALSAAAGFGVQYFAGGNPAVLLILSAFLLAWVCRRPGAIRTAPLIYLLAGLLAASYGAIESMTTPSQNSLMTAEVLNTIPELIGTVQDEPAVSDEKQTGDFIFHATALRSGADWLPVDAPIRVYLKRSDHGVQFGEQWRLKGRYTGYDKPRSGVLGVMTVPAEGAVKIRAAEDSLLTRCCQMRRKAARILSAGIESFPLHVNLLHALMLGYRQAIPPDLYQICSRAGVLHIFAISGLHVGVMAGILIAGFKWIGVPRPKWGCLLIPALFLYVISTGMRPSALRAFVMATVYFAAPLAVRRPDTPSAIALAAIFVLLMDPSDIANPGFLLSFVVVCGLVLVHGWSARQMAVLRSSGWADSLERLNGPRPGSGLLRWIGALMLTSAAAWLFSAPITAGFFYTLSPAALIANLPVIPLTSVIMISGCLAVLGGMVWLPAAALFNQASSVFINLLIRVVDWFSALPGGYWAVQAPSAWVSGCWYIGLTFFFAGPSRWRKGAAALFLFSGLLWCAESFHIGREVQVFRDRDVAVLIRLPGNRWHLVADAEPFQVTRIVRFVQKQGVNRLDTLTVSNSGADIETIWRLQDALRPLTTRILRDGEVFLPVGKGTLRVAERY